MQLIKALCKMDIVRSERLQEMAIPRVNLAGPRLEICQQERSSSLKQLFFLDRRKCRDNIIDMDGEDDTAGFTHVMVDTPLIEHALESSFNDGLMKCFVSYMAHLFHIIDAL